MVALSSLSGVSEPQYDVAISFLSKDQLVASYVAGRLAESLRVFFYSRFQEKLVEPVSEESVRFPFLSGSRVVVLLYRAPWGRTEWTHLEEAAIREGCLVRGWSTLVFVQLDATSKSPVWLPSRQPRFLLEKYSIDQLVGVIKARVEEHGGMIRTTQTSQVEYVRSGAEFLTNKQPQLENLRRTKPLRSKVLLRGGEVELDVERRRARQGPRDLQLRPKEFDLLQHLLKKQGRVFSRKQLVDAVWGSGVRIDERTVDVLIGRLRRSFTAGGGRDPIRTVRGSGYAFNDEDSCPGIKPNAMR